jgi:hypothetical protein
VKSLEEELGVTLVVFNGRKLELSRAGSRFFAFAEQMIAERAKLERDILGLARRDSTRIRIASLHGRRLHLSTDEPLSPGTSVRIDGPDFLLLGEICFCSREGEEYTAYFELEHAASDADLERVRSMVGQLSKVN